MNSISPSENSIWIASFDIGVKNFCFYIEEIDLNIKDIKNIPKIKRYNSDGTSTEEFKRILRDVYSNGKSIVHENINVYGNCKDDVYLDQKVFYNITDLLDKYLPYWDYCSHIVIEQQMSFASNAKRFFGKGKGKFYKPPAKINTRAIKVAQHVMSYFIIRYGQVTDIYDFPSYYKTQILGAKKGLNDKERKKWSPEIAINIFDLRGDNKSIAKIVNSRKKDDLADTLLQCQAFKYLYFIDKIYDKS